MSEEPSGNPPRADRPTIRDVSRAYRLFLGREVEDATAAGHHIAGSATVWDLIERVRHSAEARHHAIGAALSEIGASHAQSDANVSATPEQLARLRTITEKAWERRGLGTYHHWLRRDEPRYHDRSGRWNMDRSFEAGRAEAGEVLRLCARHGYALDADRTFVVLGAEAFRLAKVLAPLAGRYVGIEISEKALALAKRAIARDPACPGEAIHLSAFRAGTVEVDLFYSVMTLQHAPPPVILDMLAELLGKVRPGGLVLFQLPGQLHDYAFAADRYVAGEGRNAAGEIHAVEQRHVLALLAALGCTVLEVIPEGRIQSLGTSYFYVARKAG